MTPEELVAAVTEIEARSAILAETVRLLNLVGAFMSAESSSPDEDQAEAALQDRINHLVTEHPEMIGHILMATSVMLVEVADWDAVQGWLSEAEETIRERAAEIGYNAD